MGTTRRPIAVLQGAESEAIQRLLADFAARWQSRARIAGVVEDALDEVCGCAPGRLRSLRSGRSFPIFQDLGTGSEGCALDAASLVEAGEEVRRDIAKGCDLVVLSKFGKLEAERGSGLMPAFIDAIEAGVPIVTSVAPKFSAAWERFAAPLHVVLAADDFRALEDWWQGAMAPDCLQLVPGDGKKLMT